MSREPSSRTPSESNLRWKNYILQASDILAEIVARIAIEDYRRSSDFKEDACEYCREAGWKEPV